MKRILTVLCILLLAVTTITGCGKSKTVAETIVAGNYDWGAARVTGVADITKALNVIVAGDKNSYAKTRTDWLSRVKPAVQGAMFPNTNPPQGCSATVTYMGYSGPDYNSDKAEYLSYKAFVLNNTTLAKANYNIIVKLERGKEGYVIGGFSKEVVSNVKP